MNRLLPSTKPYCLQQRSPICHFITSVHSSLLTPLIDRCSLKCFDRSVHCRKTSHRWKSLRRWNLNPSLSFSLSLSLGLKGLEHNNGGLVVVFSGASSTCYSGRQALRMKKRQAEEQRLKSARGREKSSDDIFVCEKVCTSKRMLKKSELPLVGNSAPDFEADAIFYQEFIKFLDENKSLILKIVQSQNSGKLSECVNLVNL